MMSKFLEVQRILDRALGSVSAGNHGVFWRGKTRDEFVDLKVFGVGIITPNDPEGSPLVQALRGNMSADGRKTAQLCLGARQPAAAAADVQAIVDWIAAGCPDSPTKAMSTIAAAAAIDDTTHVEFWRSMDYFFLPGQASEETDEHVGRLHLSAFGPWKASKVLGDPNDPWSVYIADAKVLASLEYVRLHTRRLINEFYGTSQDSVFDSLWKFGGDLLPLDPQIGLEPERRMNSPFDWFWWIPYHQLSLTAADMTDTDVQLGRAWQVGIVAHGLVRGELEIPDFDASDPDLEANVKAAFSATDTGALIDLMTSRARRFTNSPGFPPMFGWPQA